MCFLLCLSTILGEHVQNGDHSDAHISTLSHSSKEVSSSSMQWKWYNFDLNWTLIWCTLWFPSSAWYVYGRITEKRQKEEEGSSNTVLLKEEEGKEEGRSISIKTYIHRERHTTPLRSIHVSFVCLFLEQITQSPPTKTTK